MVVTAKVRKTKRKELVHAVGMEIDRAIDLGKKIPYSVHDYLVQYDEMYSFGKIVNYAKGDVEGLDFTSPFDIGLDTATATTSELKNQNSGGIDCDGRYIYAHKSDIMTEEPNYYSFFYGRPYIAKFFHFHEGKQEAFDRIIYQLGKRAYDIRVKELTAKRVVRDVQKIVISGTRERDCFTNYFIPIYIYPREDHFMQEIPSVRSTSFEGFSVSKDYFQNKITDGIYRPEEYRHHRTLYWNPEVTTDTHGKASIRFYNNDFCRHINISAEGITKNGMQVSLLTSTMRFGYCLKTDEY